MRATQLLAHESRQAKNDEIAAPALHAEATQADGHCGELQLRRLAAIGATLLDRRQHRDPAKERGDQVQMRLDQAMLVSLAKTARPNAIGDRFHGVAWSGARAGPLAAMPASGAAALARGFGVDIGVELREFL